MTRRNVRLNGARKGAGAGLAALLLATVFSPPAMAALSSVSLVASNNQVSATGVAYTATFQVGALDKGLVLVLPNAVSGLSTANVSIQTSTDGTTFTTPTLAALNPKLLSTDGKRVAINLDAALGLNNWAKVTITGLTNPSTTGDHILTVGGKLTDVTQVDLDAELATLLGLLAESADIVLKIVAVVTNGVTNDVTVAPALTFTLGAASHSWNLDPAEMASSSTVTDTLSVATNGLSYVLQATISGNLVRVGTPGTAGSDFIPYNATASTPHFGYRVSGPAGDAVDSALFRTFATSSTNLVPSWSLSGLTNGETTTVTYDLSTDFTKSPGKYVATVTYRVVPTY